MKSGSHVYRRDVIPLFADRTGMTEKQAEEVMDIFLEIIYEYLCQKTAVHLTGFGIFRLRVDSERQARNPKTREPCTIQAGYKPEFKASRGLWQRVNKKAKELDAFTQSLPQRIEDFTQQALILPNKDFPNGNLSGGR